MTVRSIKEFVGSAINSYIPSGGDQGQNLIKRTNADYDVEWQTREDVFPSDGVTGDVLQINELGNLSWINKNIFNASAIIENISIVATPPPSTTHFNCLNQGALYYTSNATANFTLNFRGDETNSLSSVLSVSKTITMVLLVTNGATPYRPTQFSIDGTTVSVRWIDGTAPTSGNANSIDVYNFTIIRVNESSFTTLAGITKF
jgi:hypothetical protein